MLSVNSQINANILYNARFITKTQLDCLGILEHLVYSWMCVGFSVNDSPYLAYCICSVIGGYAACLMLLVALIYV